MFKHCFKKVVFVSKFVKGQVHRLNNNLSKFAHTKLAHSTEELGGPFFYYE